MHNLVFYLGMGALFTHELDAMTHHEWRVLPLLNLLSDDVGRIVFVAMHVPLFALLIGKAASPDRRTRRRWRIGISAFLVVHGALHFLYRSHPAYEFETVLSHSLIYGGALLGTLVLVLERRGHRRLFV